LKNHDNFFIKGLEKLTFATAPLITALNFRCILLCGVTVQDFLFNK